MAGNWGGSTRSLWPFRQAASLLGKALETAAAGRLDSDEERLGVLGGAWAGPVPRCDTAGNKDTGAGTIFNNSCLRFLTALGHRHRRKTVLSTLLSVPEIDHLNTAFRWRLLSRCFFLRNSKTLDCSFLR